MKIQQIKNTSQLPPEFSLEKYKPTVEFEAREWVQNLEFRLLSQAMLSLSRVKQVEELQRRCLHTLENPILEKNSISDFKRGTGFSKAIYHSNVLDFDVSDFYFNTVGDERYDDFMEGFEEHVFRDYSEVHSIEEIDRQKKIDARLDLPYYKMMEDCGIPHNGDLVVKVDLHGSDEKIISDFTKWLAATRIKLGIAAPKKKITKDDFLTWGRSSILPYIDLILWSKANGVEITQQLLGTTLFPDEYDVNLAERIRKVVAPMAKNILREVFIDALRSQTVSDLPE